MYFCIGQKTKANPNAEELKTENRTRKKEENTQKQKWKREENISHWNWMQRRKNKREREMETGDGRRSECRPNIWRCTIKTGQQQQQQQLSATATATTEQPLPQLLPIPSSSSAREKQQNCKSNLTMPQVPPELPLRRVPNNTPHNIRKLQPNDASRGSGSSSSSGSNCSERSEWTERLHSGLKVVKNQVKLFYRGSANKIKSFNYDLVPSFIEEYPASKERKYSIP